MTIRPDTHIHILGKTAVLDTKFAAESDPNVRFVNRRPYLAHPVPTVVFPNPRSDTSQARVMEKNRMKN